MAERAAFVTNTIPVELSAATAHGFLQRIKSEAKSDNLDTTVEKPQLEGIIISTTITLTALSFITPHSEGEWGRMYLHLLDRCWMRPQPGPHSKGKTEVCGMIQTLIDRPIRNTLFTTTMIMIMMMMTPTLQVKQTSQLN
jgi:hypothetical protein